MRQKFNSFLFWEMSLFLEHSSCPGDELAMYPNGNVPKWQCPQMAMSPNVFATQYSIILEFRDFYQIRVILV